MVGWAAAAAGFEQHPCNHVRVDIVGHQEFDGGHGIAALLHRDAAIHNVSLAHVMPLVTGDRRHLTGAARVLMFSHYSLPYCSKNWPAGIPDLP
jgi:hypothetical protein